ncbi:MAG TPA: twin-arginine translocase subunit TatC [Terriglobia bacterium]|nr:twin-arginine translocase subunit TatC [Terriglobia bacterium]
MSTTIPNPPRPSLNPDPEEDQLSGKQMSFLEHLEELRKRLVRSIIAIVAAAGICFYFAQNIYNYLARPLTQTLIALHLPDKLVYTNPVDPFNLYVKLALMGGLFLASPFVLFQIWQFISPGLYRNEKKYVWPFVILTSGLFMSGGFFAYRLAFPAALRFLVGYGHNFTPMVTINEYMDLTMTIMVGVGLVFELPVAILILSFIGIVTPRFLWKHVRYAILITAVLAAGIVPTNDLATMFIVWIPLVGLYVLSIGLSWLVARRKRARAIESSGD